MNLQNYFKKRSWLSFCGKFWASFHFLVRQSKDLCPFLLQWKHVSLICRCWSWLSLVGRSFWRFSLPEEISLKCSGCCVPMSCWYWYRRWINSRISSTMASCLLAVLRSFCIATGSLPNRNALTYSLALESNACFAVFLRCLRKSERFVLGVIFELISSVSWCFLEVVPGIFFLHL